MEVYTTGFTKKTAPEFFNALRNVGIQRLLDVRLKNSSQLSGFAKREDLSFFLKELCNAEYEHQPLLAPTQELLDAYKKNGLSWQEYERRFLELMEERKVEEKLDKHSFLNLTVLLCSEETADRCHRRLVLEYLNSRWGDLNIIHL